LITASHLSIIIHSHYCQNLVYLQLLLAIFFRLILIMLIFTLHLFFLLSFLDAKDILSKE